MLRVLFVAASPPNRGHLDIARELRAVARAFRKVPFDRVRLCVITATTLSDLLEEIIRVRPHIIHVAAMASRGFVYLEGESEYDECDVPIQRIADMVHAVGGVELVLFATEGAISAAYSLAMRGTRAMAFTPSLEDQKAIRFTNAFYSSLVAGLSISSSFEMATFMVADSNSTSPRGEPVLFEPNNARQNVVPALLASDITLEGQPLLEVDAALAHLAQLLDAQVVAREEPILGSFLQRFWLWIKNDAQLHQRLRDAEDAVVARGRDIPLSKVVSEYALAIERIVTALGKAEGPARVAIVLDSLLVLRHPTSDGTGVLVVKQLTREEQRRLAAEPSLMSSPQELLSKLVEYAPLPSSPQSHSISTSDEVRPSKRL